MRPSVVEAKRRCRLHPVNLPPVCDRASPRNLRCGDPHLHLLVSDPQVVGGLHHRSPTLLDRDTGPPAGYRRVAGQGPNVVLLGQREPMRPISPSGWPSRRPKFAKASFATAVDSGHPPQGLPQRRPPPHRACQARLPALLAVDLCRPPTLQAGLCQTCSPTAAPLLRQLQHRYDEPELRSANRETWFMGITAAGRRVHSRSARAVSLASRGPRPSGGVVGRNAVWLVIRYAEARMLLNDPCIRVRPSSLRRSAIGATGGSRSNQRAARIASSE